VTPCEDTEVCASGDICELGYASGGRVCVGGIRERPPALVGGAGVGSQPSG
jgi:hypothetical protein